MNRRSELQRALNDAHLALAEHDLAEARDWLAQEERLCKCDPDTRTWDENCRVPEALDAVDRAELTVRFLKKEACHAIQ